MDKKKEDLEQQIWYHGFRPRREIETLLKEPGDYLVRATDAAVHPEIIISYLNQKKKHVHLIMKYDDNKWYLSVLKGAQTKHKMPRFDTVVKLIEHYKENKMPGKVKLTKGISRPTWHITHEKVVFDRVKDLLGSGNFCHVYKGVYIESPTDRKDVAIKICHEGHASGQENEESREARNKMMIEAQLMSQYSHTFVVKLYGVACARPPVLIVMEFCAGGNLESHLKKAADAVENGERLVYSFEAARGIRYLHKNNCVHRDIAARNCLISAQGTIKIADFGLSKLIGELDKAQTAAADEGKEQIPLRWMAPESLKKPRKFSVKSDVWSYGVLLYEIFNNGEKMWPDKETPAKKIATCIRRGNLMPMPSRTPPDLIALTKEIWNLEADQRPTMFQICKKLDKIRMGCPPPEPAKFVINTIAGVSRIPVAGPEDGQSNDEKESEDQPEDNSSDPKEHSVDKTVAPKNGSVKSNTNKIMPRKMNSKSIVTASSTPTSAEHKGSKSRRKSSRSMRG